MTEPDATPEFVRRALVIRAMRDHIDYLERHPDIPLGDILRLETAAHRAGVTPHDLDALVARHGGTVTSAAQSTWADLPIVMVDGIRCTHAVFVDMFDPDRPL